MPYASKVDQKAAAARHYKADAATIKRRAKAFTREARKRNTAYVRSYLESHPCVDCGESDPIVLEFDHVRGKKRREVSLLVNGGCALKTLDIEIAKCDVRCANCHRRVTHKRRTEHKK